MNSLSPLVLLAVTLLRVIATTTAATPPTQRLRVLLPALTTSANTPAPLSPVPSIPGGSGWGRPVLLLSRLTGEVVVALVVPVAATTTAGVVPVTRYGKTSVVTREIKASSTEDDGEVGIVILSLGIFTRANDPFKRRRGDGVHTKDGTCSSDVGVGDR